MAITESASLPPVKRVYLDVCALNRPLDDQNQMRIRLESDAVLLILSHARIPTLCIVVSPVHAAEVAANPDLAKREHIQLLLKDVGTEAIVDIIQARSRAEQLYELGLGVADAAHVAFVELTGCDFVTVDDRLLRQLRRVGCRIWFGAPTTYCDKEDLR
jgi:predicted nucleic acid-binding protein